MNCRTCGTFLAEGIHICPQCGTPTATYPHDSGPDDPTAPASYARQQFPATSYGPPSPPPYISSDPYEVPPQSPYTPMSPSQPPSEKARRGPNVALVIGMVLLLIVLIGGGLTLLSHQQFADQTIRTATVTASTTVAPTATPNPSKNPYPPGTGTLVVNDSLQDNSKGYGWAEFRTNSTACQFSTGAYEIDTPIHIYQSCYSGSSPLFSNFTFEAQMKIVKGDCGAILFRADNINHNFYGFEVCQDARYEVDVHTGKASPPFKKLIPLQSSSVIHSGLGQDNVLAVVAIGNTFTFYLNHQNIDSVTDSTYSQGKIGLYASSYYGNPTEVQFSNVKVWTL